MDFDSGCVSLGGREGEPRRGAASEVEDETEMPRVDVSVPADLFATQPAGGLTTRPGDCVFPP